jgi:hypothetical protein
MAHHFGIDDERLHEIGLGLSIIARGNHGVSVHPVRQWRT